MRKRKVHALAANAEAKPERKLFTKPGSNAHSELFQAIIESVDQAANDTNAIAKTALDSGDRKTVLAAMKAGTSLIRTKSTISGILARSERVRLTKDERTAFDKDGTLPEGVVVVTDTDDEDEDED